MRLVTSPSGEEEAVTVRRSESADAAGIDGLVSRATSAVFGRVNVIHLLEKANLAVTLAGEQDAIVAHAAFLDHPVGGLVEPSGWESFLHEHFRAEECTPLNTLFIHLFVAQQSFATASAKEIMRAVFNTVPELDQVCLLSPHLGDLEAALDQVFEPLQRRGAAGPPCSAFICHRQEHSPRLHVRPARAEDHDDIMRILMEQSRVGQEELEEQPYFLAELMEEQQCAVCESDGVTVGFISVTPDHHVKWLPGAEWSRLDGLSKQTKHDEESDSRGEEEDSQQEAPLTQQEEAEPTGGSNAFYIQLFVIDSNYETRAADLIPYLFQLFPGRDLCFIAVPTLSPDFPLLQSFFRTPHRAASELYVFHRAGLSGVQVRRAVAADRTAVSHLVQGLDHHEALLQDLDRFYETRRDQDGAALQAFVIQVYEGPVHGGPVVGILIIKDEQDLEYIRSHYSIESFIYFSHHRPEDQAQILHFVLQASFQRHSRHVFKEVLRLAGRSCLYHRAYGAGQRQENSCIHPLDVVLTCAVPVRPRRQIVYPLEELGINGPSRSVTEDQAPFALSLISRKLTLEPKVAVNARIVVVGASDTGLSVLEVLCLCPHLQFNNLTLISTHGFPSDCSHDDGSFLSTSHAYSSRDLALLPLLSYVTVVTGKMVGIKRKSKYVLVSGGAPVPYDYLILCTGLQYQAPRPAGLDGIQPVTNSQLQPGSARRSPTGPAPSNLFTLNDLHDCRAARRWLCANFVELEDHAVVYGNSVDVFTAVETLLSLGVRGRRIHLVLTPLEPGAASCFSDPEVQRAVLASAEKAEVQIHQHFLLAQMNAGAEDADRLTCVSFSGAVETLRLQCGVFLNLSGKAVDPDAAASISGAFLAFDGRLVVNSAFRSSDPAVCGAGPLTSYSCCYHTHLSHASFSSRQVGQDLAAMLVSLFDPTQEERLPGGRLVPQYNQAKVQGGKLPGGFSYLQVTKPSMTKPTGPTLQDRRLVTGRPETGDYFCLHLDCYERVETLTCLSLKPLPLSNYLSLYGKQQQVLGQLSTLYKQGLIPDLYSFFRQSWCLAVFHDRFSDFEKELQLITSAARGEGVLEGAATREAVRSSAIKYLTYNRNLLPMFALPGQL